MLTSPTDIFARANTLKRDERPFVFATVIAVRGAASAKTGSKAIFDSYGKNVAGFVGGGCAESFLAREALEALKAKTPRVVSVDLDDEVFGLMPCGGVMDVYLEPHFPAEDLALPDCGSWNTSATEFVAQLGYRCRFIEGAGKAANWREIFRRTAVALSHKRDLRLRSYRDSKGESHPLAPLSLGPLVILGQTRITEELGRLARLLEWPTTVYAQQPRAELFPSWTSVCELPLDFESVKFAAGALVVVASHHQLDHQFIMQALKAEAGYVALVASEKRTRLIAAELKQQGFGLERFFAPAGLNLPSETPTQIAFSICCEILFLHEGENQWM